MMMVLRMECMFVGPIFKPEIVNVQVLVEIESKANSLHLSTPLMAIPAHLWSKLLQELLKLMAFRVSDGAALVIRWRDRALYEVACRRYLSPGTAWNMHLADYFSGNMAKKQKQGSPPSSASKLSKLQSLIPTLPLST